jgi:PAS domain S-box-containing protein
VRVKLSIFPVQPEEDQRLVLVIAREFSERQQTNAELDVLQRYNETIIQNMGEGLTVADAEGLIIFANPAAGTSLGYSPQELIGQNETIFIPPDQQPILEAAQERRARGESETYEIQFVRKDGVRINALVSASPMNDPETGIFSGSLAVFNDITERISAEEELRQSHERFKTIFEHAPDSYYLSDLKGTFLDGNLAAEEITGYKRAELIGKSFLSLNLLPRAQIPRAASLLARNALGYKTGPDEFTLNRKDGSQIVVEIRTHPSEIEGEKVILGAARDITKRKQAEDALRVTERLYRGIIQAQKDLICRYLPDGTITYTNQVYADFIGFPTGEIIGANHFQMVLLEEQSGLRKHLDNLSVKKPMASQVSKNINFKGDERWFHWTDLAIFSGKGKIIEFQSVGRDITNMVDAEIKLKEYSERMEELVEERTQELSEANERLLRREKLAVLGQLAGGVGHELRNPLGVISNAVYFLRSTLAGADEKTVEYLDILTEEVQIANEIISDLLDMGRSRPPEQDVFTISSAMANVLDKVLSPENVEVSWDVPDNEPAVYVDEGQISIVFRNLVENAFQAMPEGGKLKLEVVSEKDRVLLRVADSGIGISEENMKKIFEPLYTTKPRGIGLGLAISKNLVEANGGQIKVESSEGSGTTFTVALPVSGNVTQGTKP